MKRKGFGKFWCIFFIWLCPACQVSTPVPTLLTEPVAATTLAPYLLPNQMETPYPVVEIPPTPNPTQLAELSKTLPAPTRTPYPQPDTSTPLPSNIEIHQYFQPECLTDESHLQCVDSVIGMKFQYPEEWGIIEAVLFNGECGGYYYGYEFGEFPYKVEGGGTSLDFCRGMGANLFLLFKGFSPGQGCSKFYYARDCWELKANLVIAFMYPEFDMLCSPGPDTFFTPLMVVGVNFPAGRSVNGMAFSFDFLSEASKELLFSPYEGDPIHSAKCRDEQAKQTYEQLVEEISSKVLLGTLDEDTTRNVNQFIKFAKSISFTP